MAALELTPWVIRPLPGIWTHVIKGSFADPQFDTRGATDLFCYNRNSNIGAFFATVKNGHLDNGQPVIDGPHPVGGNINFSRRWTHIVSGSFASPFPGGVQLLFYDASAGVGEFYATDGHGQLILKKQHTGWRPSWTQILAGNFGEANLLFYDATNGTGAFYSVDSEGDMHQIGSQPPWLSSWHTIITGNFSNSQFDDLLFYDKGAGVGEFYRMNSQCEMTQFHSYDNWRRSWQQVLSGQFSPNSTFDGLLFYEEGSGHTEFYSTSGHGSIELIDIHLPNQWSLKWQVILAGVFAPSLGNIGLSSFCNYDSVGGNIAYFFFG